MSKNKQDSLPKICKATTKKGLPCRKHAMKGACFCYIHSLGKFHHIPLWKNATLHSIVGLVVAIIIAIVSCHFTASRSSQADMFQRVEYNTSLLDDIWSKQYENRLLQKYPAGYILFGVDPNSVHQIRSENRIIPRKGRVLNEYAFKWDRVLISELTDDYVTIEMPNITYIPLNTRIYGTAMVINRNSPGKPFKFPIKPAGVKNRIFVELADDRPSCIVFVIGFKPE
jgi:hypothetical protein